MRRPHLFWNGHSRISCQEGDASSPTTSYAPLSNAHQKHPRGWRILSVGRVLSIHARMPRLGWLIEIRHLSLVTDGGACRPSGSRSCSCQMASSPSLAPSGTSRSTTRHGLCPSSAPMRSMCQSHLAPRESRFEAVVKLWFFTGLNDPRISHSLSFPPNSVVLASTFRVAV